MPHYVYKYVLDKEIIYIGKTDKPLATRLRCHGRKGDNIPEEYWNEINKADIYYAECYNEMMSDTLETALIDRYKPKCNVQKKSDVSGYSLIEPLWYYYHGKVNNKLKLSIKEAELKLADVERQIQVRESIMAKKENDFYENQRKYCEECHYRLVSDRFKNLASIIKKADHFHSDWLTNSECNNNVKTFDEIVEMYRKNETYIDYCSKSYDSIGNLECKKSIFMNEYGMLCFSFYCQHNKDMNGCILHSPEEKKLSNYNVLLQWKAKGSQNYYPNQIIKGLVNWESKGE